MASHRFQNNPIANLKFQDVSICHYVLIYTIFVFLQLKIGPQIDLQAISYECGD